jgi:hypothetical protein
MESEGLIPCSQEHSTGPYPESYQSNPIHTIPSHLSNINFNIIHPPTSLVLPVVSFFLAYPPNILYAFLFSPFVLHAPYNLKQWNGT